MICRREYLRKGQCDVKYRGDAVRTNTFIPESEPCNLIAEHERSKLGYQGILVGFGSGKSKEKTEKD